MENNNTPTDTIFSSSPCIGNNDNPPTAPSMTAKGAVHAGQPGVNAAKIPVNIVVEFDFVEFADIALAFFILNAIRAKLIPAIMEMPIVSAIDVVMCIDS